METDVVFQSINYTQKEENTSSPFKYYLKPKPGNTIPYNMYTLKIANKWFGTFISPKYPNIIYIIKKYNPSDAPDLIKIDKNTEIGICLNVTAEKETEKQTQKLINRGISPEKAAAMVVGGVLLGGALVAGGVALGAALAGSSGDTVINNTPIIGGGGGGGGGGGETTEGGGETTEGGGETTEGGGETTEGGEETTEGGEETTEGGEETTEGGEETTEGGETTETTEEPTDPGGETTETTEPTDPGGTEPTDPGGTEPTDPGGTDVSGGGGTDVSGGGGTDVSGGGGTDITGGGGTDITGGGGGSGVLSGIGTVAKGGKALVGGSNAVIAGSTAVTSGISALGASLASGGAAVGALGTGIASAAVAAAPFVLGAAVVGGVGYGLYKGGKWLMKSNDKKSRTKDKKKEIKKMSKEELEKKKKEVEEKIKKTVKKGFTYDDILKLAEKDEDISSALTEIIKYAKNSEWDKMDQAFNLYGVYNKPEAAKKRRNLFRYLKEDWKNPSDALKKGLKGLNKKYPEINSPAGYLWIVLSNEHDNIVNSIITLEDTMKKNDIDVTDTKKLVKIYETTDVKKLEEKIKRESDVEEFWKDPGIISIRKKLKKEDAKIEMNYVKLMMFQQLIKQITDKYKDKYTCGVFSKVDTLLLFFHRVIKRKLKTNIKIFCRII